MPEWNSQQKKAIETKQKNILVSASAGSGKTTVLIARLMDLVMKDHVSIDAICAMTFTEAAANEMKKRLATELQKAYEQSVDSKEQAFITKQLTGIQTAHISTIHSFCLSIIQDYYYMIGLSAKRISKVMDNSLMDTYQKHALKETFALQYKKQDEPFLTLTQMFSARPENDEALQSMIQSLASLASSKSDSDAWLASLPMQYRNLSHIEDLHDDLQTNFFEYFMVESKRYEEALHKIEELFILKYQEEVKKRSIVTQKLQALPALFAALKEHDYMEFRQTFINIAHAIVPTSPDKEDIEYTRIRKELLALEDHLLALLFREDEFLHDLQMLYPYISKLVEMCSDYRRCYADLKEANEMIDFDDMEHFALAILQANNGAVADIYREQFVEIMVDEFQDSNDVQNALVNLICRPNNVFRVGDIKQSIYGFRHARPALMKGLIEHSGTQDEIIYLSNNYRSKKMIVDFNNELFKQLMNMEGFSCSYAKEDDVDTGVPAQEENNVPICFHAIFHEDIKKAENLIIAKNMLKANYIANQIITIRNKEQRKWKDFVVLVRGNARKDNLKAAFDELNIPYFIDIKYGFYQSSAVQIMLSACRSLCNPHDDIAFCALMMSPLFQQSAQNMANARLAKDKYESYYHYFRRMPFDGFEVFEELRLKSHSCSLSEMLDLLYDVNHYYSEHTTIQEKTNLDLLYEKAIQFEEETAKGIEAFLLQIEQIQDAQTAEAIPVGSEADVVRVMSIHQSKGLQFPVVFLWSTSKQTPIEFKDFCICDSELGIAMKAMDLPERFMRTTIPRIAMEHKKNKEELEEEMRILYVATTRAQQQMHIVDCVLSLDAYRRPLTMSDIYGRNGYTSWILQSYLPHNSPLFTLKEIHQMWPNQVQERIANTYQPHSYYTQPSNIWTLKTASQAKTEELPNFHPQSDGTQYGTAMHNMIERMGKQQRSETEIRAFAEELHFPIRQNDIYTLQMLYQDPCYLEALNHTCFYELPYTVQFEQEILHGYMDFVSMNEQDITIIDFKTDALQESNAFLLRYQEQLAVYRQAMQILYPQCRIHTYIYSLHMHQMIQVQP